MIWYGVHQVITGQKITASIWNDIETVVSDVDIKHNVAAEGQTAVTSLQNISHSSTFTKDLTYTVNLEFENYVTYLLSLKYHLLYLEYKHPFVETV